MITFDFEFEMKQVKLLDKSFRLFIDSNKIKKSIDDLSKIINNDYNHACPIFVCVLNGSFLFAADLLRRFEHECKVSFIKISSYEGTSSTGTLKELSNGPTGLRAQGPKIFVKILLFGDVGFCIQNCCQTLWEYFPPSPDPISPISDQNLPDFGERGDGGYGRKFPIKFSLFFL